MFFKWRYNFSNDDPLFILLHLSPFTNCEDEISTLNPQQGPFTFLPVALTRNIHFLPAKQHKTAKQIVIPYVHNNFPDEYLFTNIYIQNITRLLHRLLLLLLSRLINHEIFLPMNDTKFSVGRIGNEVSTWELENIQRENCERIIGPRRD